MALSFLVCEDELHLTTASPVFAEFLASARRAARSECTVLLRGESGTGKNVIARWMRDNSPRSCRPFVSVNCPALAGDLLASSLFGHKRGAFTGAIDDVTGKVHEAEGGTLFLDEVGDLGSEAQARLLRFLNDRSYERVGEPRERRADVRLIAATNRALDDAVRIGHFRSDLLFRLDVVSLVVPPLRARREDIMPLARHFLCHYSGRHRRSGIGFSAGAVSSMLSYGWPGNVRELRNAVERAIVLSAGPHIEGVDLGLPPSAGRTRVGAQAALPDVVEVGAEVSLEALEREHIERVLARAVSVGAAARVLGIDPTTLLRKRRRYGLDRG